MNELDSQGDEGEVVEAAFEKRDIFDLRSYPEQELYFPDEAAANIAELARDILDNGLRDTIEILPDDTTISGHRRASALKLLVAVGHEQFRVVEVLVRYDLVAAGENAIKKRFLEANYNRRHLTPMEFARISRDMYELEHGEGVDDVELRERIAARFDDISVKTLERRWFLLGLPLELQRLVGRKPPKQLPQGLAIELVKYATKEELEAFRQLAINGGNVKKPAIQLILAREVKKPRRHKPEKVLKACIQAAKDLRSCYTDIGAIFIELSNSKKFRELRFGLRWVMAVVPKLLSTLEAMPYSASLVEDRTIEFDERLWEQRIKEGVARLEAELKRDEDDDFGLPSSPPRPQPPMPPPLVLKKALPPLVLKKKELPPLVLKKKELPPLVLKELPPLNLRRPPAA